MDTKLHSLVPIIHPIKDFMSELVEKMKMSLLSCTKVLNILKGIWFLIYCTLVLYHSRLHCAMDFSVLFSFHYLRIQFPASKGTISSMHSIVGGPFFSCSLQMVPLLPLLVLTIFHGMASLCPKQIPLY